MGYRILANEHGKAVVEPTLLDGLSYPMSLGWAMQKIGLRCANSGSLRRAPLDIVAIGAAERSEERLLSQTDYWAELGTLIPASVIHLHLVGPEISRASAKAPPKALRTPAQGGSPVVGHCFRGTLREFMAARADLFERPRAVSGADTVICGFNTGFGSGVAKLMESWSLDLVALIRSRVPAIFTCANDYSDLAGESAIMGEILGANYLLQGVPSPFKAVTVMKAEDQSLSADRSWSCSSSFVYAVQGQRTAPPIPALGSMTSAPRIGKKIVALFKRKHVRAQPGSDS